MMKDLMNGFQCSGKMAVKSGDFKMGRVKKSTIDCCIKSDNLTVVEVFEIL